MAIQRSISKFIQIETTQWERICENLNALRTAMNLQATLLADIEDQLGHTPP